MKPEQISETTPLTDDELSRTEHHALAMTARDYSEPCPQCELEAPLIVRLIVELRKLRDMSDSACTDCGCINGCRCD